MSTRSRTIVFGVLVGAFTGLVAAMLLNRRVDKNHETTAITTGEGVKLGVMIFGLLRAISSLGEDEKKK